MGYRAKNIYEECIKAKISLASFINKKINKANVSPLLHGVYNLVACEVYNLVAVPADKVEVLSAFFASVFIN